MPLRENSWRGFFLIHSHDPISSVSGKKVCAGTSRQACRYRWSHRSPWARYCALCGSMMYWWLLCACRKMSCSACSSARCGMGRRVWANGNHSRSFTPKPEWQSSAMLNGRASSCCATTSHSAWLSASMGSPSLPRYQGRPALTRCPPTPQGTGSTASTGALRIRSTPRGLARVADHMPPGLTMGMKTRRTRSSCWCKVVSHCSRITTFCR